MYDRAKRKKKEKVKEKKETSVLLDETTIVF